VKVAWLPAGVAFRRLRWCN